MMKVFCFPDFDVVFDAAIAGNAIAPLIVEDIDLIDTDKVDSAVIVGHHADIGAKLIAHFIVENIGLIDIYTAIVGYRIVHDVLVDIRACCPRIALPASPLFPTLRHDC